MIPDILSKYGIVTEPAETTLVVERKKRGGLFTASELHKLLTSKAQRADNDTARRYICEKAYERITGFAIVSGGTFLQTEWGKEHEVDAIKAFEAATKLKVDLVGDDQKFQKAKDYPFGATLDGVIGYDTITEAKCPYNGGIHMQNLQYASDPEWFKRNRFDYYVQIQGGLWASDRSKGYFISYDPGCSRDRDKFERIYFESFPEHMKLFHTEIPRDEQFIDGLKAVVTEAEKDLQAIINRK